MSATSSTSLRDHPSIVTAPRGAPITVTVPPKLKRRVSRRVVVRFNKVVGSAAAVLSFWAATGTAVRKAAKNTQVAISSLDTDEISFRRPTLGETSNSTAPQPYAKQKKGR